MYFFNCHFVNCFAFVFVGIFSSLVLFSSNLMTVFSIVFGLLFPICVCNYCRFFVCGCHEVLIYGVCVCVYVYLTHSHPHTRLFWVAGLLIANTFPESHIHTLYLWLLVLVSCLCVDDSLPLLYVCFSSWAFPFVIFLFLVVAFSFTLREVPLVFVV